MPIIVGAFVTETIPVTTPVQILLRNVNRAGFFIEALAGNTGTVAVAFDDPQLTVVGGKRPIILNAGDQYVESPPDSNMGTVWIRLSNANDIITYNENFRVD